jgi:hypothetical protein
MKRVIYIITDKTIGKSNTNLIYKKNLCNLYVYLGPWNSELSRFERFGSSLVLLSVVEVVEVLVDVLFSVRALFLLCRLDPPFPFTVKVDSTTISSNASPNAAVNT